MARASKTAGCLAGILVLASGLGSGAAAGGSAKPVGVVPADLQPGRDVRGRAVVPADLPASAATRGEARRLRVFVSPPAGPGPVEVEIEPAGPDPVDDDAR